MDKVFLMFFDEKQRRSIQKNMSISKNNDYTTGNLLAKNTF